MIDALAHPDLAYVLLAAAGLAFLVEAANPGMTVPGATGIGLLVLSGLGLLHLPTSALGVALITVSVVLLGAEQLGSQPWAGASAGILLLMLGGLVLFNGEDGVNRWVLVLTAGSVTVGAVVAARTARRVRMRRRPAARHPADHAGRIVTVERAGGGDRGQVKLDGAWWTVQISQDAEDSRTLTAGQRVRVVDRNDLVLIVEPVREADAPKENAPEENTPEENTPEENTPKENKWTP